MPLLSGVFHFLLLLALSVGLAYGFRRAQLSGWFLPAIALKWFAWLAFLFLSASRTISAPDGEAMFLACGALFDHWQGLIPFESVPFSDQPRAMFAVYLLAPFYWLTGGNLVLAGLYMGLLSTAALFAGAEALVRSFSLSRWTVGLAFLLWPSLAFFGGMVGKEVFALGLMGGFISLFVPLYANRVRGLWWRIPLMGGCLWALFELKFYYAVPLGTCAGALLMADPIIKRWGKKPWQAHLILALALALLVFVGGLLHPQLKFDALLHSIYRNYLATLMATPHNNVVPISLDTFAPTPLSFLAHLPEATFYGLFGPLPIHAYKTTVFISAVENSALFSLCLLGLICWIRTGAKFSLEAQAALWMVLMTAPLLAMASPNWGTLMRYKVCFLPWLILLATWGIDRFWKNSRSQSIKNR